MALGPQVPRAPQRMETLREGSLLPSHPCGPPGGNLFPGEASLGLRTD